ncbi:hypothetical protein Tco_0602730, partial [Tanacetum coccineum]
ICPWACSCGGEKFWCEGDGSLNVCYIGSGSVLGIGVGIDAGTGGRDCTGGEDVDGTGIVDDDG